MPSRSLLQTIPIFFQYKRGLLSLRELHYAVFSKILRGNPLSLFVDSVNPFLDQFLDALLYRPVFDRFLQAKQKGERTFLLSSSPDFLVGPIAHRLGFNSWCGTQYAIDKEGRLCQISSLIEGSTKLKIATETVAIETVAYSDSEDDIPLLEWAGKAVAVQPDRRLRRLAKLRNWEIL